MKDLIIWLERQIELCDELGNMESEKFAFAHTLKKVRKEAINFTDSSLQLKEKNIPTFEFWLDVNGYELDEYKFYKDKKGGLYFKIDLENMYKKEFNL